MSSSAAILTDAVNDGYWDASIYYPTLQILDQVLGAMGVEEGNITNNAAGE